MIHVAEDKTIRFVWTNFKTEPDYDYVQIVDKDGTELTPKLSGSSIPPPGTSNSNIMEVKFHTDGSGQRTGWRLEWSEHDNESSSPATTTTTGIQDTVVLITGGYYGHGHGPFSSTEVFPSVTTVICQICLYQD